MKRLYATARVATGERVVLNINGNSYRLVVSIDFEKGKPVALAAPARVKDMRRPSGELNQYTRWCAAMATGFV